MQTTYTDEGHFKRVYPRRTFKSPIGLVYRGVYCITRANEIGEGGFAFLAPCELEIGSLIVVNFQIPKGNFVSVRCKVRNQKQVEGKQVYGVEFLTLPFERKREIRSFVSDKKEL